MESPNPASLTRSLRELGMDDTDVERVYSTFNVRAFDEVRGDG
jgi:hypothetical protein